MVDERDAEIAKLRQQLEAIADAAGYDRSILSAPCDALAHNIKMALENSARGWAEVERLRAGPDAPRPPAWDATEVCPTCNGPAWSEELSDVDGAIVWHHLEREEDAPRPDAPSALDWQQIVDEFCAFNAAADRTIMHNFAGWLASRTSRAEPSPEAPRSAAMQWLSAEALDNSRAREIYDFVRRASVQGAESAGPQVAKSERPPLRFPDDYYGPEGASK